MIETKGRKQGVRFPLHRVPPYLQSRSRGTFCPLPCPLLLPLHNPSPLVPSPPPDSTVGWGVRAELTPGNHPRSREPTRAPWAGVCWGLERSLPGRRQTRSMLEGWQRYVMSDNRFFQPCRAVSRSGRRPDANLSSHVQQAVVV